MKAFISEAIGVRTVGRFNIDYQGYIYDKGIPYERVTVIEFDANNKPVFPEVEDNKTFYFNMHDENSVIPFFDTEEEVEEFLKNNAKLSASNEVVIRLEENIMKQKNVKDYAAPEETELAFKIADRYISIQESDCGYDYTVYDMNYRDLDGGNYSNPDITIRQALDEIVAELKRPDCNSKLKGSIRDGDELIPVDYDELIEQAETAAMKTFNMEEEPDR